MEYCEATLETPTWPYSKRCGKPATKELDGFWLCDEHYEKEQKLYD